MCGLIGTVNIALAPDTVSLLRHRGPDDAGLQTFTVGSNTVNLGHRRLSIIDLSAAGHQPMLDENGSALVYNGEIYNHVALRARLPMMPWRGRSDTETLLRWLNAHGVAGLAELNGMFALAWLDVARRQLLLARDPFGIKPIYYAVVGNGLVTSSELAPMRELISDEIDPESVGLLLRLRYLPAPYTLYRKIRKLRPGHVLLVDLSGRDLICEERPFVDKQPPELNQAGFAAAAERYSELLRQAVERQLMADTEVGLFLSGGLDSALVARFARDASPGRLKAFTVGFQGQYDANEIDTARATAETLGIECLTRVISLDDFLSSLQQVARFVEEPIATTSIVPMHFLAELAAEYVKVVLSGQGADESLGGYGRYRGHMLASILPPALAPSFKWLAKQCGARNDQLLRGIDTLAAADERERLLVAWQVFSRSEILALTGISEYRSDEVLDHAWQTWPSHSGLTSVARMMRLDMRLELSDDLLLYTDRLTMRHSLECRVPYLDHDLVRYVESLPLDYKVRLSGGKRIHRHAAATLLPAEVINRPKKGFQVPTNIWFRDSGRLRSVFADHGASLFRYVDPAGVERVIVEHAAGLNRERQIFLLLMLAFSLEHLS